MPSSQRHEARDRQHHQREGRARQRSIVQIPHRLNRRDRQIAVDGPDGGLHFAQKALGSCPRTAQHERDQPADGRHPGAVRALAERRPVHDGWRRPIDSVVVNVVHDADDLLPRSCGQRLQPLADRGRRGSPEFAREVLGHDHDAPALVEIGPGETAARDDGCSHRLEEGRRDVLENAERRDFVPRVRCDSRVAPHPSWSGALRWAARW